MEVASCLLAMYQKKREVKMDKNKSVLDSLIKMETKNMVIDTKQLAIKRQAEKLRKVRRKADLLIDQYTHDKAKRYAEVSAFTNECSTMEKVVREERIQIQKKGMGRGLNWAKDEKQREGERFFPEDAARQ